MDDMEGYKNQVDETTAWLREKTGFTPRIAIVLGTGLGGLAAPLEAESSIAYEDIPHFPRSTAFGHPGKLIYGSMYNRDVAILQGRFHHYEGYSTRELTLPLRVLAGLGAKTLIVTNAAGGLNPSYRPGTIMIIRDHLNFMGDNPLRGPNIEEWGPRFPDFSRPYDEELITLAATSAGLLGITDVTAGVYICVPGPNLETPAETRFYKNCGADAIGMSTVPEVMVAKHAGMKILGLSLIANVNDPDDFKPILLEEVIARVQEAEPSLQKLILRILQEIPG